MPPTCLPGYPSASASTKASQSPPVTSQYTPVTYPSLPVTIIYLLTCLHLPVTPAVPHHPITPAFPSQSPSLFPSLLQSSTKLSLPRHNLRRLHGQSRSPHTPAPSLPPSHPSTSPPPRLARLRGLAKISRVVWAPLITDCRVSVAPGRRAVECRRRLHRRRRFPNFPLH